MSDDNRQVLQPNSATAGTGDLIQAERDQLSRNEHIKEASGYLRGRLAEALLMPASGAVSDDDGQLVKFHGMYLQDDRDLRPERMRKKLDRAYAFMIRLRIPGGVLTSKQWLVLDEIARFYANGSLRATTRQTFQYHGVIKSNLKRTMKAIDGALLDTIAACGDVNRNVLSASNPYQSKAHGPPTTWPRPSRITCCPGRARGARSGSTARRWSEARTRRSSRSTARPTYPGSSRSSLPYRRRTMSTSSRTTLASLPSSTRRGRSQAGTSRWAAAWA